MTYVHFESRRARSLTPEQRRLQRHFKAVLSELARADTSHLDEPRRRARAENVVRLRRYAKRGTFPKNRDFPGQLVPYFVDAQGIHCAVGHLMAASGAQAVVSRVVATNNHVRVQELAGDADLVAWLDGAGLTLEEAARIQPSYCYAPAELCMCGSTSDAVYEATAVTATNASSQADFRIDAVHGAGAHQVGDVVAVQAPSIEQGGHYLVRLFSGQLQVEFPVRDDGLAGCGKTV